MQAFDKLVIGLDGLHCQFEYDYTRFYIIRLLK